MLYLPEFISIMEKTNQKTLEEIIRVDHAGERGAIKIYEGQLLALKTIKQDKDLRNKIDVDGGIGPATLKAIQNLELERVRAYRVLRFANLVIKKPEQERFWFGWYRRSMEV